MAITPNLRGYFPVITITGVPIWMHWSLLLLIPVAFFLTRSFPAALVAAFSFVVLLLTHELGHVAIAKWLGRHVVEVQIRMFDGVCFYVRSGNKLEKALVSAGGVLAQIPLFGIGVLLDFPLRTLPHEQALILLPMVAVFTLINFIIAIGNLVPFVRGPRGLYSDGTYLWGLVPALFTGELLQFLRSRYDHK